MKRKKYTILLPAAAGLAALLLTAIVALVFLGILVLGVIGFIVAFR